MSTHLKRHDLSGAGTDHDPGTASTLPATNTGGTAVVEVGYGEAATGSNIVQRQSNGQVTLPAGDPVVGTDAANKDYVDAKVVSGVTWKELVLHCDQMLNGASGGILQGILLAISANPSSGDLLHVSDGSTTRIYGFGTGGDVTVTIGASVGDTMDNLAAAITGDGSGLWDAVATTGLDAYFAGLDAKQVVIHRRVVAEADDRVWLSVGTAGNIQVVEFASGDQDYRQQSGTESDIPTSDPAAKRFGFSRLVGALNGGDTHRCAEDNVAQTWDSDDQVWQQSSAAANVEGDGIDITGQKISADTATAIAEQQYGGLVKTRTADGSGVAGADAGHLAVQTDNTDLAINASNQVAVKAGSRLDLFQGVASWTSNIASAKEPSLAEIQSALGTTAGDLDKYAFIKEDGTAVGSDSTFLAFKRGTGSTAADYALVEMD